MCDRWHTNQRILVLPGMQSFPTPCSPTALWPGLTQRSLCWRRVAWRTSHLVDVGDALAKVKVGLLGGVHAIDLQQAGVAVLVGLAALVAQHLYVYGVCGGCMPCTDVDENQTWVEGPCAPPCTTGQGVVKGGSEQLQPGGKRRLRATSTSFPRSTRRFCSARMTRIAACVPLGQAAAPVSRLIGKNRNASRD
eukprot:350073-Chlamydomonas_euryale.AAC.9